MPALTDLHLHTVFSDGLLHDITSLVMNHHTISVTDHNSIRFFKNNPISCNGTRIIIGCEVTIDRFPDILVYFPNMTCYSSSLENELAGIRLAEATIIKACYLKLGYTNWEYDISRAFPQKQAVKDARTRDLAAIIHLYRYCLEYDDGNFETIDLREARKIRWIFAEENGFPFPENTAFQIAKKYNGEAFLAHPIRTAIKKASFRRSGKFDLSIELKLLLERFLFYGGSGIEWEFFTAEQTERYELSAYVLDSMREIILDFAKQNQINLSIGTDTHSLENFDEGNQWLCTQIPKIYSFLPTWSK